MCVHVFVRACVTAFLFFSFLEGGAEGFSAGKNYLFNVCLIGKFFSLLLCAQCIVNLALWFQKTK